MNKNIGEITGFGYCGEDEAIGEPYRLVDGRFVYPLRSPAGVLSIILTDNPKSDTELQTPDFLGEDGAAMYPFDEVMLIAEQTGAGGYNAISSIMDALKEDPAAFQIGNPKPLAQPAEFYTRYIDKELPDIRDFGIRD